MSRVYHIPKGTTLYRCQPSFDSIEPRQCSDTHRVGLYFGDHILLALGMCIEYQKDMILGTFVTTKDLDILHGKYSYRTDRYYDHEGKLIPHISPTPDENISHIDTTMIPLDCDQMPLLLNDNEEMAEIFLTDISSVELISVRKINHVRLFWQLKDLGLS